MLWVLLQDDQESVWNCNEQYGGRAADETGVNHHVGHSEYIGGGRIWEYGDRNGVEYRHQNKEQRGGGFEVESLDDLDNEPLKI